MKADKGNATVIMNTTDYHRKVRNLIEDGHYTRLQNDPTEANLKTLKSICKELSKKISNNLQNDMIENHPRI